MHQVEGWKHAALAVRFHVEFLILLILIDNFIYIYMIYLIVDPLVRNMFVA